METKPELPYYVNFGPQDFATLMNNAGLLGNDERTVFGEICRFAGFKNSPRLEVEEMILEIIHWAETHNYAPLRLTQGARRVLLLLLQELSKKKFCRLKQEDTEISAFLLVDPGMETINHLYRNIMEREIADPFPKMKNLHIPILPEMMVEINENELNTAFAETLVKTNKVGKILMDNVDAHVLISPKAIPHLANICMRKINKFFKMTGHAKILDYIVKTLELVMPEKVYSLDTVTKIINMEATGDPFFFVHFCESLMSRLEPDKNVDEIQTVYIAAALLKRFKLEQVFSAKEKEKEDLRKSDEGRLMKIFENSPRPFVKADIYHIRETDTKEKFTGTYEKQEFPEMVDRFLDTHTKPALISPTGESTPTLVPVIYHLMIDGRELFIHRNYLIPLLERERMHASGQLKKFLTEKWTRVMLNYETLPEMKREKDFDAAVADALGKKFPMMANILSEPARLYELFFLMKADRDINSRLPTYFYKDHPTAIRTVPQILGLDRNVIFKNAYEALPFHYRSLLVKWLFILVQMLFGKKKESASETKENENGDSNGEAKSVDALAAKKAFKDKMRKSLAELEQKHAPEGNLSQILDDLHNKWNIKMGEVRKIIREKIDSDVDAKADAIYKIMVKVPGFAADKIYTEIREMANNMVLHKYTDIHDKKSLARYMFIRALYTLKLKNK